MIKIITGYSHVGGSTVALKNLAKEFLSRGIECQLFGPHNWHLQFGSFCKPLNQLNVSPDDLLITHFINLEKPNAKKTILSCHEMWWFDFKQINKYYDKVQFLTKKQADYHNTVDNYVFIPNVKEKINCNKTSDSINVAGVIGAIDERKNPVESIHKALQEGCRKVLLFGPVLNQEYFKSKITPLLGPLVSYMGYQPKEVIYSSIDRVYHLSRGEVASLVKDECYTTGTIFIGNENTDNEVSTMTNDEIIELWMKELTSV